MPKVRKNIYFPETQWGRLQKKSEQENLPIAEIVRRAVDIYLAWDDPNYSPEPNPPQKRTRHSSPCLEGQGPSGSKR
jgi:hypothetical protein